MSGENGFYSGSIAKGERNFRIELKLNSNYTKENWGFTAQEQVGGPMDTKLRRDINSREEILLN